MPVVKPHPLTRVLVTGANGHTGMWVVRALLEQGYSVRCAVRSLEKGRRLRHYFYSHGARVEIIVVHDITKERAFDEAVKDVDAIIHMAAPLFVPTNDPHDYIKPAVLGTVHVLQSALKFGTDVRRIIITSSVGAILSPGKRPTVTFDESYWGIEFVSLVEQLGNRSTGTYKYCASKTLAERAAWDYFNIHKAQVAWDLVALNLPLVLGPSLNNIKTAGDYNPVLTTWFDMVFREKGDKVLMTTYGYVHVQDAAAAHAMALQKEVAGGERMIISEGVVTFQETRDLLYSLYPKQYRSGVLPRGNIFLDKSPRFKYNNEKGKRILGLKYKGIKEILRDTLEDFQSRYFLVEDLQCEKVLTMV